MGALRIITRVIALVKITILARLLTPVQFGLFGIASLVLAFLEILTEIGINAILIQENLDIKKYLGSVWLVSIFRGILVFILILILSIPIAHFFNSPETKQLLYLISLVPLIRGFINPAIIKYQKNLDFNKEFNLRLTLFVFDACITIIFVIFTNKAEGLVLGIIASALLEVVLSYVVIRPLPKLRFELEKIKNVVDRGKWITLSGIFEYLFNHGDDIVVGKFLNTASLGLYQVAYKISTLPITESGEVISKVVFPVYVKISRDKERIKKAYLKVLVVTSVITVPFGLVMLLLAEPFVIIFLGNQWLEVVPVLKVLSVFGVIRAISGSSSALFLALKKQEYITIVTLASILGLALTILPLIKYYGIVGAGYSTIIGALASIPFMYYFARKELYEKS